MEIKKLPKSQIEIQLSVPAQELENFLDMAAEELGKDIKIDGFRPGKAPRNIVEQKLGSEKVLAHGAEKAVKKSYVDSITKNKIEAIGEPKITITKIAPGNDLEFKVVVSVMPEITLGNHRKDVKNIKKEKKVEVSEKEVNAELDNLARSRAKLITVNRGAQIGDRAEIDFEARIEGKTIEGGVSKNHPLTIGENYFIPGFEDKLVGMNEGEEKTFELPFPSDYHKKELAGKLATFKVKIGLVQQKDVPKIDDEFAKSLGKFENLEKLKANLREGMKIEKEKKNQEKWRTEAIEEIVKGSQMEIPDILLEGELDKMMVEFEQNIAQMGLAMEAYLTNLKKSKIDLRKDWQEPAAKRVKAALALREIAEAENIKLESKEIEEEMNKVIAYYKNMGSLEKNIDMERLYNYTKGVLLNEKVFQLLENLK
jgi:trigger factor